MIKTQLNLDDSQLEKMQAEIDLFTNEQADVFFGDLINVFSSTDFEEDYEMRKSYLRWFTEISFRRFLNLPINFLKDIFFKKEIAMSFLLGYDVLDRFLLYVASNYYLKSQDEVLGDFNACKESMKNSGAIIGKIGEKSIAFSEVIVKFRQIQNKEEFKKYLNVLFEDLQTKDEYFNEYFLNDKGVFVENVYKFTDFMFGSEKKDIFRIADEYARTGNLKIGDNVVSQKEEKAGGKSLPVPSYSEIKSKIIQFFPKNEASEIIDSEGVFEVLEKTAAKYNDEKIKELYYYNEATGKFEWGV
ncbi:MAG TPA: hypothetical protein P5230_01375 [Candidatus Magasanikbacteria bacterium]|nr:hypothetical protein [Candidatus Magasanikbacteria bacterium]